MKLLGSIKEKITKNKNDEKVPQLKITEMILVHCDTFNNQYKNGSKILSTFVLNKSFNQILNIPSTR